MLSSNIYTCISHTLDISTNVNMPNLHIVKNTNMNKTRILYNLCIPMFVSILVYICKQKTIHSFINLKYKYVRFLKMTMTKLSIRNIFTSPSKYHRQSLIKPHMVAYRWKFFIFTQHSFNMTQHNYIFI